MAADAVNDDPFEGAILVEDDPFKDAVPQPSFEAAFPTNMYDGLSLGEAMERYKDIVYRKDENGEHTRELNPNIELVGNSHRFVREDGSDSLIPEPETSFMGGAKMLSPFPKNLP